MWHSSPGVCISTCGWQQYPYLVPYSTLDNQFVSYQFSFATLLLTNFLQRDYTQSIVISTLNIVSVNHFKFYNKWQQQAALDSWGDKLFALLSSTQTYLHNLIIACHRRTRICPDMWIQLTPSFISEPLLTMFFLSSSGDSCYVLILFSTFGQLGLLGHLGLSPND